MLMPSASLYVSDPAFAGLPFPEPRRTVEAPSGSGMLQDPLDDDASPVEWSEEDIVQLHCLLLQEIQSLANPETPLEEKFDTLRWVFTEREKDGLPFSFTSCLRVAGCSPLSTFPYCGLVDAEEVRDRIRNNLQTWLSQSLERYPDWVREAIVRNPEWVAERLSRNPQCINEKLKRLEVQPDLFT